jgi:hypothetical protein
VRRPQRTRTVWANVITSASARRYAGNRSRASLLLKAAQQRGHILTELPRCRLGGPRAGRPRLRALPEQVLNLVTRGTAAA